MVPFLRKFFPLEKSGDAKTNMYCMYDSQALTSFTSFLYIAGLAASLVASRITAKFGRKFTMVLSGCTILLGAAVNGASQNIAMLIIGCILLGFGVGFTNQPIALIMQQQKKTWGWRLSLGFAAVPAAIMILGVLIIPDTPSSLVERGKMEEAEKSLEKARGDNTDVTAEFAELIKATELTKAAKEEPFQTIGDSYPILSTNYWDQCHCILCPCLVSVYWVWFLFLEGGVQMFIFQITVAGVLAATTGISGTEHISKGNTVLVLVFMCIYAAGFGWSWGPLSWLVPSEIFPLNIRPTGQSISVAVNFATTFVLSQTFLSMLCCFKFGAFFFYAGWIVIKTIFIALFLPETKGIPLDSMHIVWNQHWYWHKFVKQEP
uniref:Major facilitator superfamily (MFS) profile domain-containing protein n=1 Tax=Chenopodium quinoa TaxID=63459 RepID=A0A803LUK6_CHEQI